MLFTYFIISSTRIKLIVKLKINPRARVRATDAIKYCRIFMRLVASYYIFKTYPKCD